MTGLPTKQLLISGFAVLSLGLSTHAQSVEYRFYHPDALGSNVVVTDPYGEPKAIVDGSGNSIDPYADSARHLFTGQELDAESGLHYFGARYYDPFVGRFLSVDPELSAVGISFSRIQSQPGNLNSYSYVLNRPTVLIDPTGAFAVEVGNMPTPQPEQTPLPQASPQVIPTAEKPIEEIIDEMSERFLGVSNTDENSALPDGRGTGPRIRISRPELMDPKNPEKGKGRRTLTGREQKILRELTKAEFAAGTKRPVGNGRFEVINTREELLKAGYNSDELDLSGETGDGMHPLLRGSPGPHPAMRPPTTVNIPKR